MDKAGLLASPTFCLLPWIHTNLRDDGSLYSCRQADQAYAVGRLTDGGLAGNWNAAPLRNLRLNMLEGFPSEQCQGCYENEARGEQSLRLWANQNFPEGFEMVPLTTAEGRLPGLVLRFFEVRWGKNLPFWEHLAPYLDEVEEAIFSRLPDAGGEHNRILTHWRSRGMRNVRLRYRTGCDPLPAELVSTLAYFADVEVTVDLEARLLYSDQGLVPLETSLRNLRAHVPSVRLKLNVPFSALTAPFMAPLLSRWFAEGHFRPAEIALEYVAKPSEVNPQLFPDTLRTTIIDECQALRAGLVQTYGWEDAEGVVMPLQDCLNRMCAEAHPEWRSRLVAKVQEMGIDLREQEANAPWLTALARDGSARDLMLGPTFCAHAWTNLNSTPDGRAKLCCNITREDATVRRPDGTEATFWEDGIEAIWNSPHLRGVRSQMLAGRRVADCDVCYRQEANGEISPRKYINEHYLAHSEPQLAGLVRATTAAGELEVLPTSLELRLGNQCNLRCNSCSEWSSNSVGAELTEITAKLDSGALTAPGWLRAKVAQERTQPKGNFNWPASETFHRDVARLAPQLRRLYLTGGEPTMIRANQQLVDQLIEADNLDCRFSFTTNLTLWNPAFYEKIARFRSSEVQVSIDGLGVANDYMRAGSEWATLEKNFAHLLALPEHVAVTVFTVVQACNAPSLDKLVLWLLETSKRRPLTWYPIPLDYPFTLQAALLPRASRERAVEELTRIGSGLDGEAQRKIGHGLQEAVKFLKRELPRDKKYYFDFLLGEARDHELLISQLDLLDAARGTNWQKALPELVECLCP